MDYINEEAVVLQPQPVQLLQSASLRLPDSEEYDFDARQHLKDLGMPTSTESTGAQLRVRHHHMSFDFTRKVVSEVGDLLNNNLIGVVTMTNNSDNDSKISSESNFDNITDYYSNLSFGNRTDPQDYLYRHSPILTTVYCVAYFLVFVIGLVGNCLVVAVVFRAPRMRTVTNLFIVNLAIADILVVVLCIPATLLSNIFVREYFVFLLHFLKTGGIS